jgi:DNA-binding NtrC family response regulator
MTNPPSGTSSAGILTQKWNCKTAGSAEEALSILDQEKFDLIISDIRMDGMTGLELIPHALKSAPDTMIMMISGEQTIDSAISALRLGAFDLGLATPSASDR